MSLKNERDDTISIKAAFFEQRLRDEIYSRRLQLRGTNIFIGEDLTQKKATLAYEARQYVKTTTNASTWTTDGVQFLKDKMDAKPRVIHNASDLKPEDPTVTETRPRAM